MGENTENCERKAKSGLPSQGQMLSIGQQFWGGFLGGGLEGGAIDTEYLRECEGGIPSLPREAEGIPDYRRRTKLLWFICLSYKYWLGAVNSIVSTNCLLGFYIPDAGIVLPDFCFPFWIVYWEKSENI